LTRKVVQAECPLGIEEVTFTFSDPEELVLTRRKISITITIKWGISGGTITDPEWNSGSTYYFKVVTEDGKYMSFTARPPNLDERARI